jgi:hypothetical protein
MRNRNSLAHAFALSLAVSVFGVSFDAWWHVSSGRESFFVLPHLFIYGGVVASVLLSFLLGRRTHQKVWRNIFIALLIIPLTAPLDELWHKIRGVEQVESVLIVWSPPHVLLFAMAILAVGMFISVVRKDTDLIANRVLGKVMLAALLSLVFILLVPFFPIGPHHVLGFWGAGVTAFMLVCAMLGAVYFFPGFASASTTMSFFIVSFIIFSDATLYSAAAARLYGNIPNWLIILSFITPALWIDMSKAMPVVLRALIAGSLWCILFFGFAHRYLALEFAYPLSSFYQALISSIGASLAAAIFFQYIKKRWK